ncbi:hypothetical protein H6501_01075 [Candidatus Woesearchaeota archaeon]|nr:hypothetical protein [Nanoarchaeota archaeon]MCB9370168.1 hypothetical protein [Candidatus Woesearchaeota archaeon]USN44698.1 MAG: hypothetical protein H6500_02550 [Candidatus Woesearchaeota archaeon]
MGNVENTPLDYSDKRRWVYFELGGKKFLTAKYVLEKIDFISQEDIVEVEYGFKFFICNQHIPEVVKILEKENHAIYQIIRM